MQTVLLILLFAGVFGIAVTIWIAVRGPVAAKTDEPAEPGQEQERESVPSQLGKLQKKLSPGETSLALALPVAVAAPPTPPEPDPQSVGFLLNKAHDQLKARQQGIESEIARIETLRREHDAVTAQVKALDAVMTVFTLSQAADPRPNDSQRFAARANGASLTAPPPGVREDLIHPAATRKTP